MNLDEMIYEKAFVFFDTNMLECRIEESEMFLHSVNLKQIFYDVNELIKSLNLEEKVRIFIPEIVWMEYKRHMVESFISQSEKIKDSVEKAKKSFGDMIEISYESKYASVEQYKSFLDDICIEFLNNPRFLVEIAPYPRDEKTFEQLIYKANNTIKPFSESHKNGKKYSDAGFKDAVIYETIIDKTKSELGIFVTEDKDFSSAFNKNSNVIIMSNKVDIKNCLMEKLRLDISIIVENILSNNENSILNTVLEECELFDVNEFQFEKLLYANKNDNETTAKFLMIVNNQRLVFDIVFEINTTALISSEFDYYESEEDEKDEID